MNKPLVSIVAGSSLLALSLLFGVLGMTDAMGQKAKSLSHEAWMAAHDDATAVSSLEIPGTHDTLALYGIADLAGQCQSMELEEQLKLGVRFLDIRLERDGDNLKAVHGIVDERQTFATTIRTMSSFLKDHPTESLFVSIKDENSSKSNGKFEECLKKYIVESDWYLAPNMPATLGQCRGKMVLLSRYDSPTIGIDAGANWKDNASFALNEEIYVQDFYKMKDPEQKKPEILSCLEDAHPYRINFLSGYLEGSFPPSYAPSVAKVINPWIKELLPTMEDKGFMLFDFVTSELIDAFFQNGGAK